MNHTRAFAPVALGLRSFAWNGGSFDSGHRPYTEDVTGTIRTPHHVVLVTLSGGARHMEVTTDCGHVWTGPDRPGAVSLVPAHCERRAKLFGVEAEWASIALPAFGDEKLPPFTNAEDPFLFGLVGEMARLMAAHDQLDETYCEAMSHAASHYLQLRYGNRALRPRPWKLSPWQLRRIADHVEAHLDEAIAVADLAAEAGISAGHLHRAFRATTGTTPLAFIRRARIRHAVAILSDEAVPVAELALRVGFESPSRFARAFRHVTGVNPSRFGMLKRKA